MKKRHHLYTNASLIHKLCEDLTSFSGKVTKEKIEVFEELKEELASDVFEEHSVKIGFFAEGFHDWESQKLEVQVNFDSKTKLYKRISFYCIPKFSGFECVENHSSVLSAPKKEMSNKELDKIKKEIIWWMTQGCSPKH